MLRDLLINEKDIINNIYRFLYISASFKSYSPIVANNYYELIYKDENQIKVKDKDIIQFTGHQPVGIAPVFNISKSNNNDNYNMVFSIDRYNNVDNLKDFENQYNKYISDLLLEKGKKIKLKTEIEFNENAEIYNYNYEKTINEI